MFVRSIFTKKRKRTGSSIWPSRLMLLLFSMDKFFIHIFLRSLPPTVAHKWSRTLSPSQFLSIFLLSSSLLAHIVVLFFHVHFFLCRHHTELSLVFGGCWHFSSRQHKSRLLTSLDKNYNGPCERNFFPSTTFIFSLFCQAWQSLLDSLPFGPFNGMSLWDKLECALR